MNKEEITKIVHQSMIDGITSVINGEKTSVELLYARPGDILSYITSIGGVDCDDFDTNGWQWDYWFTVSINGKEYCVSGDAYYQNYASFGVK